MSSMGIRSLQLDSAKNGDRMAEIDFILEASPRFEFFFFFFFFYLHVGILRLFL